MSFNDPMSITYDGANKDLVRVNQDKGGSEWYLDDGDAKFSLTIAHTIPSKGGTGESHLLRLDVENYLNGEYVRTDSAWMVMKTVDAPQVTAEAQFAGDALAGLAVTANIAKLLGREN